MLQTRRLESLHAGCAVRRLFVYGGFSPRISRQVGGDRRFDAESTRSG
jgi:hypothetical protein